MRAALPGYIGVAAGQFWPPEWGRAVLPTNAPAGQSRNDMHGICSDICSGRRNHGTSKQLPFPKTARFSSSRARADSGAWRLELDFSMAGGKEEEEEQLQEQTAAAEGEERPPRKKGKVRSGRADVTK